MLQKEARGIMTASSAKPVRECKDCSLNLGNRCAVFHHPAVQWRRRKCEGYNSAEYMARYEKLLHAEGAKARRLARQARAKLSRTVDHLDGVRALR